VVHAQSIGLSSQRRSLDELPSKSEFDADAVVSFEPFTVYAVIQYAALLRMLSEQLPFVMLYTDGSYCCMPDAHIRERADILGMGYDYGAEYASHEISPVTRNKMAMYATYIIPSELVATSASLDLEVLRQQPQFLAEEKLSPAALATRLKKPIEEIAASVMRLMHVFEERLKEDAFMSEFESVLVTE